MATFDEVLAQAQMLSEEERNRLGLILLESTEAEPELDDAQKAQIEATLLDRVDGPFLPVDGMAERIKARGRERLKARQDAGASRTS